MSLFAWCAAVRALLGAFRNPDPPPSPRHAQQHDDRGILAMANSGSNSNRSQFFITYGPTPHLDNVHAVFGKVIHGFDVLDGLERVKTGKRDRPLDDIVLTGITIHANPLAT